MYDSLECLLKAALHHASRHLLGAAVLAGVEPPPTNSGPNSYEHEIEVVYTIVRLFVGLPEVNLNALAAHLSDETLHALVGRLSLCPAPETPLVKVLLHSIYSRVVDVRWTMRGLLALYLRSYLRSPPRVQGVVEVLELFGSIVSGFTAPLSESHRLLLLDVIMPLHTPNGKIFDMASIMSIYHNPLVFVVSRFLEKDPSLFLDVFERIQAAFPPVHSANSPKEALLIHEMEKLLEYSSPETFKSVSTELILRLARCTASLHHIVSERALQVWRSDKFISLVTHDAETRGTLYQAMLPILLATPSWNKTVNRMRGNVLRILEKHDAPLFASCAIQYFQTEDGAERARAKVLELHPDIDGPLEEEEDPLSDDEDTSVSSSTAPTGTADNSSTASPTAASPTVPTNNGSNSSDATTTTTTPAPVKERPAKQQRAYVPKKLEDITHFDFVFGHDLGTGAFATVQYAKKIRRGVMPSKWKEYAIKVMEKEVIKSQGAEENIAREIQIMKMVSHPSITRLVGTCVSEKRLYLVLEYASKGDLHNHLSRLGSLSVDAARFVTAEIVLGLEALHAQGIIYGDLKPENVLVHSNGHVKLADFGSARFVDEVKAGEKLEGTAEYMSPELLRRDKATPECDLWALGCVIFQLLAGHTPLYSDLVDEDEETERDAVFRKIVHFSGVEDGLFPSDFPAEAQDLVSQLLKVKPSARLGAGGSFSKLKEHAFFSGIDFGSIHDQKAPEFSQGSVAPQPDKGWTRRKMSLFFSPLPRKFDFALSSQLASIPESSKEKRGKLQIDSFEMLLGTVNHASRPGLGGPTSDSGPTLKPIGETSIGFDAASAVQGVEEEEEQLEEERKMAAAPMGGGIPRHNQGNPFAISMNDVRSQQANSQQQHRPFVGGGGMATGLPRVTPGNKLPAGKAYSITSRPPASAMSSGVVKQPSSRRKVVTSSRFADSAPSLNEEDEEVNE